MLSNLGIVTMDAEDGPCLEAILDAKAASCLLCFDAHSFFAERPCVALPITSMFRDAIESREISVRGPLTGHLTGRVLRSMFA